MLTVSGRIHWPGAAIETFRGVHLQAAGRWTGPSCGHGLPGDPEGGSGLAVRPVRVLLDEPRDGSLVLVREGQGQPVPHVNEYGEKNGHDLVAVLELCSDARFVPQLGGADAVQAIDDAYHLAMDDDARHLTTGRIQRVNTDVVCAPSSLGELDLSKWARATLSAGRLSASLDEKEASLAGTVDVMGHPPHFKDAREGWPM